ncbi:uncharacterized protein LOC110821581 isoform X2 [Carica papaya]|nr:uncharacterized protein LOC110821581 isoform X2 [Carica papaya]
MLRTRLLWSTLGFSVTGAAIAHFVWRDLYAGRHALSAETVQKFRDLEARVSILESNPG